MTVDTGLIFFRGDFHLPRRFRVLFRVIHRIVVMAGTTGRGVILFHARPFTLGKLGTFGFKFFRGINRVGDKCLVKIVAGFQLTFHHAWNIRGDMAIVAFRAYAGSVLEMYRLFIFLIHRLHTMAADAKLCRTGQFDTDVR